MPESNTANASWNLTNAQCSPQCFASDHAVAYTHRRWPHHNHLSWSSNVWHQQELVTTVCCTSISRCLENPPAAWGGCEMTLFATTRKYFFHVLYGVSCIFPQLFEISVVLLQIPELMGWHHTKCGNERKDITPSGADGSRQERHDATTFHWLSEYLAIHFFLIKAK